MDNIKDILKLKLEENLKSHVLTSSKKNIDLSTRLAVLINIGWDTRQEIGNELNLEIDQMIDYG
jgi:hypothetical protein